MVSDTAVVERRSRFWIVPNRLVVVRNGAVECVLVLVSDTAVIQGRGEIPTGKFVNRLATSEDLLVPRNVRITGAFPSLETLRIEPDSAQPEPERQLRKPPGALACALTNYPSLWNHINRSCSTVIVCYFTSVIEPFVGLCHRDN